MIMKIYKIAGYLKMEMCFFLISIKNFKKSSLKFPHFPMYLCMINRMCESYFNLRKCLQVVIKNLVEQIKRIFMIFILPLAEI